MIRDNTDGNVRFCFPVLIFNSGFSHYCIQDIFDSIYVENGFYTCMMHARRSIPIPVSMLG